MKWKGEGNVKEGRGKKGREGKGKEGRRGGVEEKGRKSSFPNVH